jgi:hypothetical protein
MRALRTTIIVLAITAGIYTGVDYLVGIWHRHHLDMSFLQGSPAYRGQPYATEDFIREKALEPGQWLKIPGESLLAPTTYDGTFFHVDELPPTGIAYRRTINPPADARPERVVLLVGGSTVYGPEVPDELTIASQLSRYLNARDPGHRYVVYNAGVNAADSTQDRDRLAYELKRGLRPAVVVVADGQLDIVYGIYQGKPGQPAPLLESRSGFMGFVHHYLPTNIAQMVWLWFHDRAVAQRRAEQAKAAAAKPPAAATANPPAVAAKPVAAASPPVAAAATPPVVAPVVPSRPVDRQTAEVYRRNHLAMGDMATKSGAAMLSVLPPSPFSTQYDHPTADLRVTLSDTQAQLPGLVAVEREGQAALVGVMQELAGQGRHTLDLSDAFKAKTNDVFVDLGHLNGVGNGVIAEKIGQAVLEILPPS